MQYNNYMQWYSICDAVHVQYITIQCNKWNSEPVWYTEGPTILQKAIILFIIVSNIKRPKNINCSSLQVKLKSEPQPICSICCN